MSKARTKPKTTGLEPGMAHDKMHYVLRLYVAGLTPRSVAAIQSVRNVCEGHLRGRYDLEVINVYDQPTLAKGEQIIAAPTLVKKLPLPLRRIIGDMADTHKLLVGLDLREIDA